MDRPMVKYIPRKLRYCKRLEKPYESLFYVFIFPVLPTLSRRPRPGRRARPTWSERSRNVWWIIRPPSSLHTDCRPGDNGWNWRVACWFSTRGHITDGRGQQSAAFAIPLELQVVNWLCRAILPMQGVCHHHSKAVVLVN